MRQRTDRTGYRCYKLTVLGISKVIAKSTGEQKWLCQCECGGTKEITWNNLHGLRTTSCGCQQQENKEKNLVWEPTNYISQFSVNNMRRQ